MSSLLFFFFVVCFADAAFVFMLFAFFSFLFFVVLMHVTFEAFFTVSVGCAGVTGCAKRGTCDKGS